jgi:hypothetical protein
MTVLSVRCVKELYQSRQAYDEANYVTDVTELRMGLPERRGRTSTVALYSTYVHTLQSVAFLGCEPRHRFVRRIFFVAHQMILWCLLLDIHTLSELVV